MSSPLSLGIDQLVGGVCSGKAVVDRLCVGVGQLRTGDPAQVAVVAGA